MYTPAVTMVAAWMRAETGVGPAMASGSQTWSGICALLPAAPSMSSRVMAVIATPPAAKWSSAPAKIGMKSSVPKALKRRNMASRKPTSPIRLTMKAFFPASDFSRSLNQ